MAVKTPTLVIKKGSAGEMSARGAALVVVALGLAELAIIVAGLAGLPVSDTLGEALGTVHALGGLVVVLVLMKLAAPAAGRSYAAISVVAAAVLIIATLAWLTWLGQPLIVDSDQGLRLLAIVAGDLAFGVWLIVGRLLPRGPRPPAMATMGVVLTFVAVLEALSLPPLVPVSPPPGGAEPGSLGGPIVMALLGLVGFILLAVWQLVVARWLATLTAAPVSSPGLPVSPAP